MKLAPSWILFALGSAFFAALTALLGKIGVSDINSNLATLIRTVVILALTFFIVTYRQEWQPLHSLPASGFIFLLLSGIATGLSWLCYYRALQLGPASKVAPLDKLSVVMVIIFAALFLRESLTWKTLLGAGLITGGAILIVL